MKYLAELAPMYRLIVDELPPLNTKLIFLNEYGHAIISDYHREYGFVAWCPLPKLTTEQKEILNGNHLNDLLVKVAGALSQEDSE